MPRIVVSTLNITMHPHSAERYKSLLTEAASIVKEVAYFGSRVARLGPVNAIAGSNRYFRGVIYTFDKIDADGEWFDQEKNDAANPDQVESIFIPSNLHPNLKRMEFILDIDLHRIHFQTRNVNGDSFAPRNIEKVFREILNHPVLQEKYGTIDVNIVPLAEAVDRILDMRGLSRLHIHLVRPNPDDNADAHRAVLEKLHRQNAKSLDIVLAKTRDAERIVPDSETISQAKVAADGNGYVEGTGRGPENQVKLESTKNHPRMDILAIADKSIDPFDAFFTHVEQTKI